MICLQQFYWAQSTGSEESPCLQACESMASAASAVLVLRAVVANTEAEVEVEAVSDLS